MNYCYDLNFFMELGAVLVTGFLVALMIGIVIAGEMLRS